MKLIKNLIIYLFVFMVLPVFAADKNLDVTAGESFNIELKSNSTTGYQWQIDKLDNDFLELETTTFVPSFTKETNIVGAGGTEVWMFKALKPGKTSLSFKYLRVWENNKAKQKCIYKINIK